MNIYHTEIGLPAWFKKPSGISRMFYSTHSKMEAARDRYGAMKLPACIDWDKCNVIEVYATGTKVEKVLVRASYDSRRDICFVIRNGGFVITTWSNLKTDTHRTLKVGRYTKP